jgi:hypothetical protein
MYTLMIEAVRTSETSVFLNKTTQPYIPEGCHNHIRHPENLNYHTAFRMDANGAQRRSEVLMATIMNRSNADDKRD